LTTQLRPYRGASVDGDSGGGGGKEGEREGEGKEEVTEIEEERRTGEELFRTVQSQPIPVSDYL
jgi:hypothetical protein